MARARLLTSSSDPRTPRSGGTINCSTAFAWGSEQMHRAEYYAYLKKVDECQQKARQEPDLRVRRALESVAREYLRCAEQVDIQPG
jgi:hypothetical protein